MITHQDLRTEVQIMFDQMGEDNNYDVTAIADEVKDTYGLVSVDDVDSAEFWAIVAKHQTA